VGEGVCEHSVRENVYIGVYVYGCVSARSVRSICVCVVRISVRRMCARIYVRMCVCVCVYVRLNDSDTIVGGTRVKSDRHIVLFTVN